ncbi:MAG: GNAT family N-acetyltransferase [Anaerolineales bacterium]|nr:GNAT family N-acetyltransferase [Anaerolineales bacterium]
MQNAADNQMVHIRPYEDADFDAIWLIFESIVSKGETYAYDPDTDRAGAFDLWIKKPQQTFVANVGGEILGTYYIKPNQPGLGAHVCNCGYMVAEPARGQGIATTMCLHSQEIARSLGYQAMQFNLVVSTNEGAVRLWLKLGYEIVGTIPDGFNHVRHGLVDAFVMYKRLT